MPLDQLSRPAPSDHASGHRNDDVDLELWKHFARMGGIDKNTMITTVSWLLALAAAIVAYMATEMTVGARPWLDDAPATMVVSVLGLLISGIAAYVALLYAGYANTNWASADRIARRHGWHELLPDASEGIRTEVEGAKPGFLAGRALQIARPCHPHQIAPVFVVFVMLALLATAANAVFLAWSLYLVARG